MRVYFEPLWLFHVSKQTNSSKGLKVTFKLEAQPEMQKEGAAVQTPRKDAYAPLLTGKHTLVCWMNKLCGDENRLVQN